MDLYTLFNNAVTAVAGNATLTTYANTNYGRDHAVKTDPPPDGLPGESGCPMVILHSPMKQAGRNRREVVYGFGGVVFIYEPDLATRAEDNVEESAGTKILITMAQYVKDAVRGIIPTNWSMSYSLDTDTVGLFPLLMAEIGFEFIEELSIGSGDPLL